MLTIPDWARAAVFCDKCDALVCVCGNGTKICPRCGWHSRLQTFLWPQDPCFVDENGGELP